MCLEARAQLYGARGDETAARTDLDVATEIFERLESRLELARALVVRAEVGESRHEDLERARELFEGCRVAGDFIKA